jgi:hypothetical protein
MMDLLLQHNGPDVSHTRHTEFAAATKTLLTNELFAGAIGVLHLA